MGAEILVEVDGGINLSNISEISSAGADIFVAGSAIFNSENYAETIAKFKGNRITSRGDVLLFVDNEKNIQPKDISQKNQA